MFLDKRSEQIVRHLVLHPNTTSGEVARFFNVTRNQLNYSVKRINEWCKERKQPGIQRLKNGHFQLPEELTTFVYKQFSDLEEQARSNNDAYIFSEDERGAIIFLMIFSKDEYVSLNHFIVDLDVSKNTAMRSLKYLRGSLPATVTIQYKRETGYELVGSEWEIRKYVNYLIPKIRQIYNGSQFLKKYLGISNKEIEKYHSILENAERMLQVKYTDDRLENLPYVLALMDRRIDNSHIIQESFHIHNNMLADTKEFYVASKIFDDWGTIRDQERLFITLQLLTTNIFSGDVLTAKLTKELSHVVDECLLRFEDRAVLDLPNKDQLKNRLLLHLKPAYYRIKYHLNLNMSLEKLHFSEREQALKQIIYEAFLPFQNFVGEAIPDEEYEFIALFVLSGISDQTNHTIVPKKAVVVCKSGILISQTLNTFLQKIFPDFDFLPPVSLRDFDKLNDQADVVFSTVPIATRKDAYLVKPLMNQREIEALRFHVISNVSGSFDNHNFANSIKSAMNIIMKYAEVQYPQKLEDALTQLFYRFDYGLPDEGQGESLMDLLSIENIEIVENVRDYRDAIYLASRPLIKRKILTENYVSQAIANHDFLNPYTILGDQVAIPHALPKDGVSQLGVSLLYVRQGVHFSDSEIVYFIFIIAPIDKEKHIEMLYQIMRIAEDERLLKRMRGSDNKDELYELIDQEMRENSDEHSRVD
ncbi:BglG family transcription antiterminator [Lacticaseibacillus paracasei]